MFSNYKLTQKQKENPYLTENQIRWLEIHKLIMLSQPLRIYIPKKGFKKMAYDFIEGKTFNFFIKLILLINLISLSVYSDSKSKNYKKVLNYLSLLFTIIIWIELLTKIVVYGLNGYFVIDIHKYEFLVAFFYLIDSIFFSGLFIFSGMKILRIFGFLKIISLFRLLFMFPGIITLFSTLFLSLPLLFNTILLFFSIFLSYAIFGCFLFHEVIKGKIIDDYINFRNVLYGMSTLFSCFTSENWTEIMQDLSKYPPNCIQKVDCGSSLLKNIFFFEISFFYFINIY